MTFAPVDRDVAVAVVAVPVAIAMAVVPVAVLPAALAPMAVVAVAIAPMDHAIKGGRHCTNKWRIWMARCGYGEQAQCQKLAIGVGKFGIIHTCCVYVCMLYIYISTCYQLTIMSMLLCTPEQNIKLESVICCTPMSLVE